MVDVFHEWLDTFIDMLKEAGLSPGQTYRFYGEFRDDAKWHFSQGRTPSDAVAYELLGPPNRRPRF